MKKWWEITSESDNRPFKVRAVAYYRHSAQDRQENSIPLQRDQVREWAEKHHVEIIKEFADHGKSGLNAEGRLRKAKKTTVAILTACVRVRNFDRSSERAQLSKSPSTAMP